MECGFEKYSCCFLGHRKIPVTAELENKLYNIVEKLIIEKQKSNEYIAFSLNVVYNSKSK